MPTFQCLFYSDSAIAYWENIECAGNSLQRILDTALKNNDWHRAEAWLADKLICRIERQDVSTANAEPERKLATGRRE